MKFFKNYSDQGCFIEKIVEGVSIAYVIACATLGAWMVQGVGTFGQLPIA